MRPAYESGEVRLPEWPCHDLPSQAGPLGFVCDGAVGLTSVEMIHLRQLPGTDEGVVGGSTFYSLFGAADTPGWSER